MSRSRFTTSLTGSSIPRTGSAVPAGVPTCTCGAPGTPADCQDPASHGKHGQTRKKGLIRFIFRGFRVLPWLYFRASSLPDLGC
ncbi:hypothetical protein TVNIR_1867 [Thioalkalivibrio nitratireducens DSM 14787]|uniref:Uncharacterized protein n=1 Tax=Thioalkalivibrio nitratireducens (strain DSM 14787 / UNIQEM 213 / ALEN2) TaxID=1255043 RepID=L0DWV7_THIND|nr:hypothetical protein TVNIR_1867 [Thioalkalivibrio nitratireducens DSM 14787]